MATNPFGLSNNQYGAIQVGLGGAAGLIPTPTSTSGSSSSSTTGNTDIQSLLHTLSQIYGTQSQQGTSTGTTTGTTTGGYATPGATNLSNSLASAYGAIAQPTNLSPYEAQQTQQINTNSGATDQAQQAALAARGLSTSPVAGAVAANTQAQRVGQITNLQQQIPLLQQQLNLQNLSAGNSYLANAPKTQTQVGTTAGTTNQVGTTTQTGDTSQTGSTQQNSTQQNNTVSNQQQKANGGLGGLFGGLGAVLSLL